MKWGVRRFQNPDGSLTEAGKERYGGISKKDRHWAARNRKKLTGNAYYQSRAELNAYAEELMRRPESRNKDGRLSASAMNAYNRYMAQVMNQKVSNVRSPEGRVIHFVAKRGELGVHMAIADQGYNIDQLRNGIWSSGRIAYRKTVVDQAEHSELMHMGRKGMKWGVLNGPPYPIDGKHGSTSSYDYGRMKLSSESMPTVTLSRREYAHVMHEVATNASPERRRQKVFRKIIFDEDEGCSVSYAIENGFDGTYRVIDRKVLSDPGYDWGDEE